MLKKGNKKIINAWAFYDWANSVYPLVINNTIFPIYYESITRNDNHNMISLLGMKFKNTALLNYALSLAYLLIVLVAPLLSGIADYSGKKKRFMQFFCYLGALSCSAMYLFTGDRLELGILLIILACIGYSGSLVFYNAYLPEIAAPADQDRVSAKGFALGYIGSALLLLFNLSLAMKPEWYGGISKGDAARMAFITVGIWWVAFAQYTFYFLPNSGAKQKITNNLIFNGYKELRKVWNELKHNRQLVRYLRAFFIYNMGVQTVMMVATLFAKTEINMETPSLITTILIIQFVAVGGAYLFSFFSKKRKYPHTPTGHFDLGSHLRYWLFCSNNRAILFSCLFGRISDGWYSGTFTFYLFEDVTGNC